MNIKPLNQKKYMVWGHQLDDIERVINALATVSHICEEDYPDSAVLSIVSLACDRLNALTDMIEDEQEISL